MASLQKIKNRVAVIGSTKKITKAMELISAAKFSKIKRNLDCVRDYYENVKNIFINLIKHTDTNINALLNDKPSWKFERARKLYIVFGSDAGLCGAYNANMLKKINEEITDEDILICVGSNLEKMLAKRPNTHIIQSIKAIGDEPTFEIAKLVANKIYEVLQISDLLSISIIYTKYLNPILSEPRKKDIFPITFNEEEIKEIDNFEIDADSFEPSPEIILKNSFVIFFEASIYYALYSSKLSEMSMKRTAMEQATKNADDLINNLKLEYNRIRQSKITQEITEIVSGSNVDN